LKAVKAMDAVNAQSKSKLSNLLGHKLKKQPVKSQVQVKDLGELSAVKNMIKSAIQAGKLTHADCRATFDKYKTTPETGKEYLTEPDYKRACRDLKVPIDSYGFARLDKNNSGTIDFGEFLKVLLTNNN